MIPTSDDVPLGRDEEAADWCIRLAEGELLSAEQRHFDAWLAEPANREAFEDAITVWDTAQRAAEKPEMVRARTEALESFRRANGSRWTGVRQQRWYWPASAAAAVILLLFGSLFLFQTSTETYRTGIGERRIAMLKDGSRLSLDAASAVEVSLKDDRRQLRLVSGRAKFDVAKDPLRPFTVAVGDKLVVATGTSFSVELLRGQVHVLLYEGHVEVLRTTDNQRAKAVDLKQSSGSETTALTPGRELVTSLASSTATVIATDLPRASSWEFGQLSFDNEPLYLAVERMNRYSHEKLVLGDVAVASVRVNGVFTAGDTAAFLEGVTAFNEVRVEAGDGHLKFKSN